MALYNFVHGATAAIWNMRWHVNGYLASVPQATRDDLEYRFVSGSGIHGVNVRKTFAVQSWGEQTEELARITLTNTVSLFESWAEEITRPYAQSTDLAKRLQFPSRGHLRRVGMGIGQAPSAMTTTPSRAMTVEFVPSLQHQPKLRPNMLDDLLVVYRYFKELRNSLMHGGGLASPQLLTAHQDLSTITVAAIGEKEVPEHHVPQRGSETPVSLRGAIGLGSIVYAITTTVDVLLAGTQEAENVFAAQIAERYNGNSIPTSEPRRSKRVRGIIEKSGYPRLDHVTLLGAQLKARGVITY